MLTREQWALTSMVKSSLPTMGPKPILIWDIMKGLLWPELPKTITGPPAGFMSNIRRKDMEIIWARPFSNPSCDWSDQERLIVADHHDIVIVEIGGTVEVLLRASLLEAIRQMRLLKVRKYPFIHLPRLYVETSGELKPTQHSVKNQSHSIHLILLLYKPWLPLTSKAVSVLLLMFHRRGYWQQMLPPSWDTAWLTWKIPPIILRGQ